MQNMGKEVLLFLAGGVGILLALRYFRKPFRFIFRILASSLLGGVLLMLLNTFGAGLGLYLPVNPVTALLVGFLGVPGVLALLFIQLWL